MKPLRTRWNSLRTSWTAICTWWNSLHDATKLDTIFVAAVAVAVVVSILFGYA